MASRWRFEFNKRRLPSGGVFSLVEFVEV